MRDYMVNINLRRFLFFNLNLRLIVKGYHMLILVNLRERFFVYSLFQ